MLGTVTYKFPPDELEFEVQVPDLPEDQKRVTVYVHLMREIDGEEVTVHRMKVKLKKKNGSDIASKTAFWDPSDSEDKKGKTHRLVVVLKLEEEESLNKTEEFRIRWGDD